MTYQEIEDLYNAHLWRENWPEDPHPDGCFYCGSPEHATCSCPTEKARTFWDELRRT